MIIGDRNVLIRDNGDFEDMLYEELGYEAGEFFHDALRNANNRQADEENDAVYALQEEYDDFLRELVEPIKVMNYGKMQKKDLARMLYNIYQKVDDRL